MLLLVGQNQKTDPGPFCGGTGCKKAGLGVQLSVARKPKAGLRQQGALLLQDWMWTSYSTKPCPRAIAWSHCFFPNLSGIHDCAYSDCQRHRGDFREVTIKKPGISQYSVHSQCLHSCPGHQTWSRLIEGNVTVWANTCDKDSLKSGSLAETVIVRSRTNSTLITGTSNTSKNRQIWETHLQFLCSSSNVLLVGMTARASSEVNRDSSLTVLGQQ